MAEQTKQSPDNINIEGIAPDDYDQLAQTINTFYTNDTAVKSRLSYHWERNQMMLDGNQWIVYEGGQATGGLWKPVSVSSENEYIPRPVTNYMFDAFQTLKSYILKNKPRSTVKPNTQTNKDKTAAKLSTMVLEATYEKLKDSYNYEYAASNLVTYGTVFKKDFWDNTPAVMAHIPRTEMQPTTDPMTGQVTGEQEVAVLDEYGNPVIDALPIGDVNTSIIEPYRISLDPMASDLHNARWIMETSIQQLEWIKTTYNQQKPGYTGRAEMVKPDEQLSGSMRRWWQLKNTSGTRDSMSASGSGGATNGSAPSNSAVVKEFYSAPTAQYPKGRLVVVAGKEVLYSYDSPYEGPDLGDWHPYSECRWEIVPGRFWGKSPLDAGAELQKKINSIDAVITLTRKTQAIPQKLIPIGQGVTPGQWTGRPGQEIFYRDTGGAKPETILAAGVHESVFVERKQTLEDFKQITGAIDILKGDRPAGVSAASALNMLYEVGTGKLFPILDRWKSFVENSQKKQLKLIGKRYREPREDFILLLKSRNSSLSDEEINNFIGTDLNDNYNVNIEAGSNIPKLQAAHQANLMEAAQTGALALENPVNRTEFLEQIGITGFDTDVGPDLRRAEWENDIFDNLPNDPTNVPIVLECDQDAIHIKVHEDYMKQPAFMSKPLSIQQAVMKHVSDHKLAESQKMQQQALQSAMMGMPAQLPQNPTAPQKLHPAGSGAPAAVTRAMSQDVTQAGKPSGRV